MDDDKQSVRERVWRGIESTPGVRRFPGVYGRIPNFVGAEAAARSLARLPEWQAATVLKLNPDSPQLPVRVHAIDGDKLLYMAVPKLASRAPFIALSASELEVSAREAATIEGSSRHGKSVALSAMRPVDLIVCGTVAVNPLGVRIGKGGGYSDLEYALLAELGLVDEHTKIATTVHDLQVLEEELPETEHDFRVDLVVTPTRVLRCPGGKRPKGIVWEHLDEQKIASIPALVARRPPSN